jgi:hypothetical protein
LIDLWNAKNRSKHLFGDDIKKYIRDIDQEELKDDALKDIKNQWIPTLKDMLHGKPEAKIPLAPLIWTASLVARQLMLLTKGNICGSKKEALYWLADEYREIREMINLLIKDFEKPDEIAMAFNSKEALILVNFCLRLLCEIKR